MRRHRLKAENLDKGATGLAEPQARVDYARVVAHKHGVCRQQLRQFAEYMLGQLPSGRAHKQLAAVALRQRMLGNPLVGEVIIEFVDTYVLNHAAKLRIISGETA